MAILDATALLPRGREPAAARDYGAQAHRSRDQTDGVPAVWGYDAVVPVLLAPQRLHDDLRREPVRTWPSAGGAGGAQRAVRIVPLLRIADRREPERHRGVQQQVRRARRVVFLGSAEVAGRGALPVSG